MSKCAIVIFYDGVEASEMELRDLGVTMCKLPCAVDPTSVTLRGLNEKEVLQGLLAYGNAVVVKEKPSTKTESDLAAIYIGELFRTQICAGEPTFATALSSAYVMACIQHNDQKLINAVRILARVGAYDCIHESVCKEYNITIAIVNIIRNIYETVCQGRIEG